MGQCGCCDFHPEFKLEGPPGVVYTIQLDPGCPDCQEHRIGLIIHRLEGETITAWDAQHTPDFEMKEVDDGGKFAEARYLVLNPEHLERRLIEELGASFENPDLAEIVKDAVKETLRDAIFDSRKEAREG